MTTQQKDNWQIKKLGEICTLVKGKKPKKFLTKGNKKYLTAKVIRETEDPLFVSEECTTAVWVKEKDIVIIMDGSNSGEMFTGLDGALASTMGIIEYSKDLLFSRYLLYFLITHRENFTKSRTGAAIPHLNKEEFENLEIPLPPLSEQKRIVKILDEVFTKIEQAKKNAEQNLKNAKELFDSSLEALFEGGGDEWEEKSLEEISIEFGRGKSKHRPRNAKILFGGDYPFIQTGDIRNCNHLITSYTQTYNEVGLAQSKLWRKGTICITIAANIAETGVLGFNACFPDSVIGITVNPKITDNYFVEYLLQFFKVEIQKKSKGSAQANINMATFQNYKFPFPPLKTQQEIVKKLDTLSAQTQKLEKIYQRKIENLDELKKSFLQKAFAGHL